MREVCKDPEQRRWEIVEVVLGAVRDDKRPIRIPLYSNVFTWKICDAGYTMREATQDYDVMFDAVCQHHEKYHFDLYQDFGTRNPFRLADAAKTNNYIINDERNSFSIKDRERMYVDEYPKMIKDEYAKFCFETLLPRLW